MNSRLFATAVVLLSLAFGACSSDGNYRDDGREVVVVDGKRLRTFSKDFGIGMGELRDRLIGINEELTRLTTGGAKEDVWITLNLVIALRELRPERGIRSAADLAQFQNDFTDMSNSMNQLYWHTERHQRGDALESLDTMIERFNNAANTYWDGEPIPAFERSRDPRLPRRYQGVETGRNIYW